MSDEIELELSPPYATTAAFYADVERNLAVVFDAYAPEGVAPTCRKGCDACCHQLVMITVAEAREAARILETRPRETQAAIRERITTWHEATADLRQRLQSGADEALEDLVEGIAADYWQRRVPCPFLEAGSCAIYEGRPLACRHHFSVSDPALCATSRDEAIEVDNEMAAEFLAVMDDAFFLAQDAVPEDETEIGMLPELVGLVLAETI
ncbi:YkgJ family cysteine cluster protein [bacterium]|nr:YkgJ family cysteine cluster protein [bacterium]